VDLSVTECGPADAPTLLFVHGAGAGRWQWEPQLARLSQGYHCLVVELPGHGESAGAPFGSIADCAERLHSLIKTRAHKKAASVVGVGLGAQVLLDLMARFPGRVGKAVLLGTQTRPMRGAGWIRLGMLAFAPFRNLSVFAQARRRTAGIPETFHGPWAEAQKRMGAGTLAQVLMDQVTFVPPAAVAHVAVPVLLLTGDRDDAVLQRSADDLVGRMRNARAGTVPGFSQAWNLTAPEGFADTVHAWMTGKPLPDEVRNLTQLAPIVVPDGPIRPPVEPEDDDDEWWEET
jgi:pimeloyl-ACP methyl ester carboxylesterase